VFQVKCKSSIENWTKRDKLEPFCTWDQLLLYLGSSAVQSSIHPGIKRSAIERTPLRLSALGRTFYGKRVRCTRVKALPSHLHDYHCYSALTTLHEPHSFCEAHTNPLWQNAMPKELNALIKTHTWDLIDLPPGKTTVGCKWVYKIETKFDGSVE
jgi:hypothetical protein